MLFAFLLPVSCLMHNLKLVLIHAHLFIFLVTCWIFELDPYAVHSVRYDFYTLSSNPAADDRDYSRPLSVRDEEQSTLLFRQVDLLAPAWQDCLLIERPSDYSSIGGEMQVYRESVGG